MLSTGNKHLILTPPQGLNAQKLIGQRINFRQSLRDGQVRDEALRPQGGRFIPLRASPRAAGLTPEVDSASYSPSRRRVADQTGAAGRPATWRSQMVENAASRCLVNAAVSKSADVSRQSRTRDLNFAKAMRSVASRKASSRYSSNEVVTRSRSPAAARMLDDTREAKVSPASATIGRPPQSASLAVV